jgi:hypothetical protein
VTFLHQIQLLFERTYASSGVNFEDCLISTSRFEELSRQAETSRELSQRGQTFLRVSDGKLYLAIYYHPEVIRILEDHHPMRVLNSVNIRPLIVFVEELNHALHASLMFLENQKNMDREEFLCNLELQAKVDTYLTLELIAGVLLKRKKPLSKKIRRWLQHSLFGLERFDYENRTLATRYWEANHLGRSLVKHLDSIRPIERLKLLRQIRPLGFIQKKQLIEQLEAGDS